MTDSQPIDAAAFRSFEHSGWEASAAAYGGRFGSLTTQTIPTLLDAAEIRQGVRLLDVATGPGYAAAAAAERGALVTALDFSPRMIARARASHPNTIRFEIGDAESLPHADESFQAVVTNFGLLHFARPDQALQEAFRVLEIGGKLAFAVWAPLSECPGFAITLQAVEEFGNSNVPLPPGPPFFRFSDPSECEASLKNVGFAEPTCRKVPLMWQLSSAGEVFEAFYKGSARTGGLLRAQPAESLSAIRNRMREVCEQSYSRGSGITIPMAAWVVSAVKK